MTTIGDERTYEFRGLSTDVKPIGSNCMNKNVDYAISNGSVYFEMDTGNVFMLSLTGSVSEEGEKTYTGAWLAI